MVATFHLHCLGHRVKYGNPEVGNTTQQLLSTKRPCCSIEFFEWFLFWVILVTYNIGIYICIYIYKVSNILFFFFCYLHLQCFFCIACLTLWDMKKYFVKLMSRLLHSTIHQVMWYFWVFIVNPFSLLCSIFFSRKLCFICSPWLLLIAELIKLDTSGKPNVEFFLKITCPSSTILSISIDELNSIDSLLKNDEEFSWNNSYFNVAKEFWYGKKY